MLFNDPRLNQMLLGAASQQPQVAIDPPMIPENQVPPQVPGGLFGNLGFQPMGQGALSQLGITNPYVMDFRTPTFDQPIHPFGMDPLPVHGYNLQFPGDQPPPVTPPDGGGGGGGGGNFTTIPPQGISKTPNWTPYGTSQPLGSEYGAGMFNDIGWSLIPESFKRRIKFGNQTVDLTPFFGDDLR